MLQTISVTNYALIRQLEIDFFKGLSIITGETGAGKSILLGALSLILGNRAESSVLFDKSKKCIVEGVFKVEEYGLEQFFAIHDLDYALTCILRREITPAGKSRAFINDTPVNLSVLKEIGIQLVDIHSQHQSLELGSNSFQLKVIDQLVQDSSLLEGYVACFKQYKNETKKLADLKVRAQQRKVELDYLIFQLKQLDEAQLINPNEQVELEGEEEMLSHSEEIKQALLQSISAIDNDETAALPNIKTAIRKLSQISSFFTLADQLAQRLDSVGIELNDVCEELEKQVGGVESDPGRLEWVQARLSTLFELQQKHHCNSLSELISLRDNLSVQVREIESFDDEIENAEKYCSSLEQEVRTNADELSKARSKVVPIMERNINSMLADLGMPNAVFKIENNKSVEFFEHGADQFSFLFSSSKNGEAREIHKVASGGEMSRLMLCIKSLLTESSALPTLIFDEIDTGVSGDVADKVGDIINRMSAGMQVINITHLPQIAAKGTHHYKVFKVEDNAFSETHIELLSNDDRLVEIAKMLSGKDITEAALENARSLLGGGIMK